MKGEKTLQVPKKKGKKKGSSKKGSKKAVSQISEGGWVGEIQVEGATNINNPDPTEELMMAPDHEEEEEVRPLVNIQTKEEY